MVTLVPAREWEMKGRFDGVVKMVTEVRRRRK